MSLLDKVAIVTGASAGIGAAIAVLFAKEGAHVVLVGRNVDRLKNIFEQCNKFKEALVLKVDISKDDEAESIITETVRKFGKIDILVNNAAILSWGTIMDGKMAKAFDEVMATNLRATVVLTTLAAPHIIKTKGNIVNISSALAAVTPKLACFIPYGMTKIAMEHFTRGVALELSTHGVRVNAVQPGPVKTDILENHGFELGDWKCFQPYTALNRVSDPEEVAELTLFVASDKGRGITGSVLTIDNGMIIK